MKLAITGLTSHSAIFDHVIKNSRSYDHPIRDCVGKGKGGDHGDLGELMAADGGDFEAVLDQFAAAGIDIDELAAELQDEGATSFVK